MSACLFSQHFWGEKHSGFDAMYQNFKLCYRTSSEFAEFLRESYTAEDNYYKTLVKLSKQAGSYNNTSSFKPCWSLLKQFIDQISQVHLTIAQERQNLSRDVQKYLEEQHKRQKLIKDTEASTQEVVHAFQVVLSYLFMSYHRLVTFIHYNINCLIPMYYVPNNCYYQILYGLLCYVIRSLHFAEALSSF